MVQLQADMSEEEILVRVVVRSSTSKIAESKKANDKMEADIKKLRERIRGHSPADAESRAADMHWIPEGALTESTRSGGVPSSSPELSSSPECPSHQNAPPTRCPLCGYGRADH